MQGIDYKRELETASRGMIMIHDPELLIKLIVRMIVGKVQLEHAGMLLFEPTKHAFVLKISRGAPGMKIPAGFARFDRSAPLVKIFTEKEYRSLMINKNAILWHELNSMIWQESIINGHNGRETKELLHLVAEQMRMLNVVAAVPAVYQDELLAILLLGEKKNKKKFDQVELDFFSALASDTAMAIRNAQLFSDLKRESQRNRDLFIRTTVVLGSAIEAKDKYTHGHTERVTNYAVAIARQMRDNGSAEFPDTFFENLYVAGMLHDIGKIGVPDAILLKPGRLTQAEFEVIKTHPVVGERILRAVPFLAPHLPIVELHHERPDGRGYPRGLRGDEIPVLARIVHVTDAYDAMTSARAYRDALPAAAALEELWRYTGTQFDTGVVAALARVLPSTPLNPHAVPEMRLPTGVLSAFGTREELEVQARG